MVLFARSLGASAAVTGLLMGLTPLFTALQMLAAPHVERVGFKRFVLAGWGTRTCLILVAVVLPWTDGFWDAPTRLGVLLAAMTLFCVARGIGSAGWMPWITGLLPAERRAHYLVREHSLILLAGLAVHSLAGGWIGASAGRAEFSGLFLVSFFGGIASLWFISRIPDVCPAGGGKGSGAPVPWKAVWSYGPFQRLVWFNVGWVAAVCGMGMFPVIMLRGRGELGEGGVLGLNSVAFAGGLVALWSMVRLADRFGSRPVITGAALLQAAVLGGWLLEACGLLPGWRWVFAALWFFGGFAGTAFARMLMATVPVMGRSHFFALQATVANLVMAVVPVAWGTVVDGMDAMAGPSWPSWANGFTLFFGVSMLAAAALAAAARRLAEDDARPLDELLQEMVVNAPGRALQRLFGGMP